jgi:hypothetical protein
LGQAFNGEGVAFRDWRGAVLATCYVIMADVQGGLRPLPDAATLISELPALLSTEVRRGLILHQKMAAHRDLVLVVSFVHSSRQLASNRSHERH